MRSNWNALHSGSSTYFSHIMCTDANCYCVAFHQISSVKFGSSTIIKEDFVKQCLLSLLFREGECVNRMWTKHTVYIEKKSRCLWLGWRWINDFLNLIITFFLLSIKKPHLSLYFRRFSVFLIVPNKSCQFYSVKNNSFEYLTNPMYSVTLMMLQHTPKEIPVFPFLKLFGRHGRNLFWDQ